MKQRTSRSAYCLLIHEKEFGRFAHERSAFSLPYQVLVTNKLISIKEFRHMILRELLTCV